MSEKNRYFVKFRPYNDNTLSMLINKQIKFSTVYEFNDPNELHYIISQRLKEDHEKDKKIIELTKNFYCKQKNIAALPENLKIEDDYDYSKLSNFFRWLEDFDFSGDNEIPENHLGILAKNIALSSVGIFSISDVNVFEDDSAHLMFAHYGDNLKGLALVYYINNGLRINYKSPIHRIKDKVALVNFNRISRYIEGNYEDIEIFENKSSKWRYENEYRLFRKPGLKNVSDVGVELKTIFYTNRLEDNNLKALEKIKESTYKGVELKEIYTSNSTYNFRIKKDSQSTDKNIYEWLKEKFKIKTERPLLMEDVRLGLSELINILFNNKIISQECFCKLAEVIKSYYINSNGSLDYEYSDYYEDICKKIISLQTVLGKNSDFSKSKIKFYINGIRCAEIDNLKITCCHVADKDKLKNKFEAVRNDILNRIKCYNNQEDRIKWYNNQEDCFLLIFPNFNDTQLEVTKKSCDDFVSHNISEFSRYLKNIYFTDNDKFYHCINLTSEENKYE